MFAAAAPAAFYRAGQAHNHHEDRCVGRRPSPESPVSVRFIRLLPPINFANGAKARAAAADATVNQADAVARVKENSAATIHTTAHDYRAVADIVASDRAARLSAMSKHQNGVRTFVTLLGSPCQLCLTSLLAWHRRESPVETIQSTKCRETTATTRLVRRRAHSREAKGPPTCRQSQLRAGRVQSLV